VEDTIDPSQITSNTQNFQFLAKILPFSENYFIKFIQISLKVLEGKKNEIGSRKPLIAALPLIA